MSKKSPFKTQKNSMWGQPEATTKENQSKAPHSSFGGSLKNAEQGFGLEAHSTSILRL